MNNTRKRQHNKPPILEYKGRRITNLAGVQAILTARAKRRGIARQYTTVGAQNALNAHGIKVATTIGSENYYDIAEVEKVPVNAMRGRMTAATQESLAQKRALAIHLHRSGTQQKDIAAQVDAHPITVNTWIRQGAPEIGDQRRQNMAQQRNTALALLDQGMTPGEVARELGCAVTRVYNWSSRRRKNKASDAGAESPPIQE